jgi:tRNA A37 threonylcarbamoyladenosine synthetase subunit TsaC/SUA5/YrdC
MWRFPLCPACRAEYEDPTDRRFHAEPNACPVCGPRVRLVRRVEDGGEDGPDGGEDGPDGGVVELAEGKPDDPAVPIRAAAELLRHGEILAVKGLGGFHLACDATDGDVVRRLKERKRRPHKSLAVMFASLEELRAHCRVSPEEEDLLVSPEHPIVLLEWRDIAADGAVGPEVGGAAGGGEARRPAGGAEPAVVTPEVATGQRYLGAMLPYTPLHILLLREFGRPLVMTSGNLAEEPIVKGWEEIARLAPIADAYLVHDREIAVRYDDSVALVRGGRPRLIRRSRGYAPFPVALPRSLPQILACGAELKNTFCLTRDANAFLSQHVGDLENLETLEHYETSIAVYEKMFRLAPEVIGYDLHPEYLATKFALALPQPDKVAVQHHHAHIAARLVESGREEAVIGVSMDGLGYGDDGRLWGGEVFVCDLLGYRRVAHLEELPLPGGATAIEKPWRTALGWSYALLGEDGLGRGGGGGGAPPPPAPAPAPPPRGPGALSAPTRTSPSSAGRSTPASTRRSRPAAGACSTRSPPSPACATRSPTRARRRSSSRCAPRPAASRIPTPWRVTSRRPPARPGGAPVNGSRRARPVPARTRPRPSCVWRRCSRPCSTNSRPAPRPAPSAPVCTPPSRPSCSTSAAGCVPRPASRRSPWPAASSRTACSPTSAKPFSAPTASTCSPRASCR